MKLRIVLFTATGLALTACAQGASNIQATYVSPMIYANYDCDQIRQEKGRVGRRVTEVAGKQDDAASGDAVAMGIGLVLFWPALFFISGSDHAAELGRLRGEYDALQKAAIEKQCPDALWKDQGQQAFAAPADLVDPVENTREQRNCLDQAFADTAECRKYLAAWEAGQATAQSTSAAGTGYAAATATSAPREPYQGDRASPVDPVEITGGQRNCSDQAFADLVKCREWMEAWNADQARRQAAPTTGTVATASVMAPARNTKIDSGNAAVDGAPAAEKPRSCTDPAYADLPECHRWLEEWNAAQAEGRPPPSPQEPLRTGPVTSSTAAAPVAVASANTDVEMAAYGVSLARYRNRNEATTSWRSYVARFPLLGAATTRVVPATAVDGTTAYVLQGTSLTKRQARTICDTLQRAYEFCEVIVS